MAEFTYNNAKQASTRYTSSSSTAGTTHAFYIKRTSTPTPGSKQLMSWLRNLGILWLHAERTYNMPQNCKNELTIKELSLKVMLPAKRFDWTANISKLNAIGSWTRSSLGIFEFCIRWVVKSTNSNSRNDGGSMMFSTCPFWSWTT